MKLLPSVRLRIGGSAHARAGHGAVGAVVENEKATWRAGEQGRHAFRHPFAADADVEVAGPIRL